jgi:cell division protein FtsB
MVQYKGKFTKAERRLIKRIVTIVVILGILWILFAPNRGLFHYRQLQHEIDSLARENILLEQRNKDLQKEVERLKSDEKYLEELARQKYGLLKENETVYEVK